MPVVTPRGLAEPRENPKPDGWDRARLGVVVPLCVVVAVAIICIIVAALTSAHRADEVALENEKKLLTRAIVNHGEWSLRRLRNIIVTDDSIRGLDLEGPASLAQSEAYAMARADARPRLRVGGRLLGSARVRQVGRHTTIAEHAG